MGKPAWQPRTRKVTIRGKDYHQIDWWENGKRLRKTFSDFADLAEFRKGKNTEAEGLRELRQIEGKNAVSRLSALSPTDRTAVLQAFALLTAAGGSSKHLVPAVEEYIRNHLQHEGSRSVQAVLDDLLDAKRRANRRERTLKEYKDVLRPFLTEYGERNIHTIALPELETWLRDRNLSPSVWNKTRILLTALWKHALRRKWGMENIPIRLETSTIESALPAVFEPAQVAALLQTAAAERPAMVPYLTLAVFAGIRPQRELSAIKWTDVQLDTPSPFVRVHASASKVHLRRDVPLSSNAVQWLRRYPGEGVIAYSRRDLRHIVKKTGLQWTPDVLRHTFGTFHLATSGDIGKTATVMGNSPAMVKRHYLNMRTPEQAKEFWEIAPKTSNVIQFAKAVAS
jgi:integrase